MYGNKYQKIVAISQISDSQIKLPLKTNNQDVSVNNKTLNTIIVNSEMRK